MHYRLYNLYNNATRPVYLVPCYYHAVTVKLRARVAEARALGGRKNRTARA
jgi:hypothetical protein